MFNKDTKFKKGMIPWNKGKKAPQISKGKIGKSRPDMINNKFGVGNKKTEKWKKTMKKVLKNNKWNIGKKHTEEHIKKIAIKLRGNNNPLWNGGSIKWNKNQAKMRDDFTCQLCRLKDPEIVEVDHIIPKAIRKDLYNKLENLMTLCPNCHARKTKKDRKLISKFKQLQ